MVQIKELSFSYGRLGRKVFENFSLDLAPGRVYGLLGKNGVGKSTLIYLMAGLLKPSAGKVEIDGEDVRNRKPSTLADVFIVPEEVELPSLTLRQFVDVNAPFYPRFNREILDQCLEAFGLSVMDINLKRLSMGMKKKVYMSFALAANTSVLIMDEPTNGLDIPGKSQFRKVMTNVMTEDKLVLISTHQVRDIDSLLDHVVIVDNSQVLLDASIAEVESKLSFKMVTDLTGTIYYQPAIGGTFAVVRNVDGESTNVDLEMLFNAALCAPDEIKEVFNKK